MFRIALSLVAVTAVLAAGTQAVAAQTKTPPAATKPASAKPATTAVVNINTASATEIAALPGIGDKTAARIVEYRQKNGPFKKVEEILETSRSGPILLRVSTCEAVSTVARSRRKPQEISQ